MYWFDTYRWDVKERMCRCHLKFFPSSLCPFTLFVCEKHVQKHSFFHVSPVLSVIDMKQKITKKVHWHVVGHLNTHIQMNMHDVRSLFVWHWIVYIYKNKKMTLHHGHCSYKCFTWVSQCMWAWWILFRFHRSIFTSLRDFFMSLFLSVQVFFSILRKHIDYYAEICDFTTRFG